MMNKDIPHPNIVFFNSIIKSLCNEGKVMDAYHIIDLLTYIGETPDVITFNTLIGGYFLVGNMDKAIRVLDAMVSAAWSLMWLHIAHLLVAIVRVEDSMMVLIYSEKCCIRELNLTLLPITSYWMYFFVLGEL